MGYLDELDEITTVLLTRKQERELKIRAKGTNDDKVGIRKAEVWRWIKESQAKTGEVCWNLKMLEKLPSGPPELVRLVGSLRPSDKETANLCPGSIRESGCCL